MNPAALVLAGTRPGGDPLAEAQGVEHKALIEIGGRPILERVIVALRLAGVERIAVSCDPGPVANLARELGAETVRTEPGPSGSVRRGMDHLGTPLVVTTSDHALLQPEWVAQLIADTPATADLAVMLARRELVEAAMPESRRTYLRFADGEWSGCNLFYLRTPASRAAIDTWSAIEADRKRPWRMAARLGWGTLARYALGRLPLSEGLAALGRRIGVGAALVAASDGLAAVDVDKPQDLADVRRILGAE